jgi:hypothetical protein
MRSHPGQNKIFIALCVNAVILGLILLALVSRGDSPIGVPAAFGQQQPAQPAAVGGGGGIFVAPAQLSSTTWGCYLMDVDHQTLCVYQYSPGEKMLRFTASRTFRYDRQLDDYNTLPSPSEMKDLAARQNEPPRGVTPPAPKSPETIEK